MDIIEVVRSALSSVLGNKMRSVLTMLGIIIGIGAVIMITSIGSGFQSTVQGEFEKLGMNGVQISVNHNKEILSSDRLKMDDCEMFKAHPGIQYVAPLWQSSGSIRLKNPTDSERFFAIGTNGDYRFTQPIDLLHGRFIIENDVENASRVAIIDSNLSMKIFGRVDSVGSKVTVSFWSLSMELTVIGVMKSDSMTAMFSIPSVVYIPISTIMQLYSTEYLDNIYFTVYDKDKIDQTTSEMIRLLEIKHDSEGKYQGQNLLQAMDSVNSVLGNITAFISLVAAISLIVGGIGVMNIMLVTVTERTREIGIRKSLGATNGNIQFQFLVEAIVLTAIGGILGIILGYVGGFYIGAAVGLMAIVSVPTVVGTVMISAAIGIIFGVYPARKASQLNPIDALRYE